MNQQRWALSNGRRLCTVMSLAVLTMAILGSSVAMGAVERPLMLAIRVRNDAIKVDGRLDEWPKAAFEDPYERVADSPDFSSAILTQAAHGAWLGVDDLSARVRAAVTADTLYISGTIRDQLLFNEGNADAPWVGDEFEVFIDANPPEKRFQAELNENYAQFIFVPEHLWENSTGTFIWRTAKYPGVTAASRLTPLGYTFEVAIPKDVVPYWQAHHDMDSIGFDVQIGDIDNPGLIGHDAGPKINMELLQPFPHFRSAVELSTLQFDPKVKKTPRYKERAERALPGYASAQQLLDNFNAPGIERKANASLGRADLARKAALFILLKRTELTADTEAISAILKEPVDTSPRGWLLDARVYALMVLAERKKLPAAHTLQQFGTSEDLVLQQTALWAIGVNGDASVTPELAQLFNHTTGLTQEIVAISLARLGDRSSVAMLKTIASRDRGQTFGMLSLQLLKDLGIEYSPQAP